jgi:hypothetical protein
MYVQAISKYKSSASELKKKRKKQQTNQHQANRVAEATFCDGSNNSTHSFVILKFIALGI